MSDLLKEIGKPQELIMVFGDPQAQTSFNREYGEFLSRLPFLYKTINTAISKLPINPSHPEVTVMALSRMVFEDFRQILLLCSNGETAGGMKVLRGMFERAVTAKYLQQHPVEVDDFINFNAVSRYKEANEANRISKLSEETMNRYAEERKAVKDRYMVDDCKKCGTKKLNHTWTKKSLVEIAKEAGFKFVMLESYYFAMQETHSTWASIERRIKFHEDIQKFEYDDTEKPTERTAALLNAHYLTLHAIEALQNQFRLEAINEMYEQCLTDFKEIWFANLLEEPAQMAEDQVEKT